MNAIEWMLLLGMAGLALSLWRLASPAPPVLIDERGILDRKLRLGWIRWDEIDGAYLPEARDQRSLALRLRVSKRLARRLRRDRAEPVPESVEVRLELDGVPLSPVEVLEQISQNRA